MGVKFQYNKTSLTLLGKQLKVRQKALPTLKNKESALRVAAAAAKSQSTALLESLEKKIKEYEYMDALWNEFEPDLIRISNLNIETAKIAGVKVPELKTIDFGYKDFSAFSKPVWYSDGVGILKDLAYLGIRSEIYAERSRILESNRKKTTQKVNLYEKVQIPGYQEAILKIKRFMEDEENLSKASSKIVKSRHALEEEEGEI